MEITALYSPCNIQYFHGKFFQSVCIVPRTNELDQIARDILKKGTINEQDRDRDNTGIFLLIYNMQSEKMS